MTTEREIRLNIYKLVAANKDGFYTRLAGLMGFTEAELIEFLVRLDIDTLIGKQQDERPVGILAQVREAENKPQKPISREMISEAVKNRHTR